MVESGCRVVNGVGSVRCCVGQLQVSGYQQGLRGKLLVV